MKCSKAIIMAGGFGTRWLPLSKAVDKCMVPIGTQPLIDVIVDDLIAAGITDIIIRTSKRASQPRTYYGNNRLLEEYLMAAGKTKELEAISHIASKAIFRYSPRRGDKYGTAISLWQCRRFVEEGEKVLVVSGDQLLYNPDGSSASAAFLQAAEQAGTPSAMLSVPVPAKDVHKYGVVKSHQKKSINLYDRIIEKPETGAASSNLINATCYLFDKTMFDYANPGTLRLRNGEYHVTEAMDNYVSAGHRIAVIQTKAEYFDCGTPEGWLNANNRITIGINSGRTPADPTF